MDVNSIPILSIVIFLPLIGALLIAVAPASSARPLALGTAVLTCIVSLLLLIGYSPGRPGFQFVETPRGSPPSASSTSSGRTACRSPWSS